MSTDESPWIPRSRTGALAVLLVVCLVAGLAATLATYAIVIGRVGDIQDAQVESCERATADRVDNARGWTEVEDSVRHRSLDENLPASERRRAAGSSVVYGESANQLRSRLYLCDPLIRDGERQIDEARLRETQGEL